MGYEINGNFNQNVYIMFISEIFETIKRQGPKSVGEKFDKICKIYVRY